MYDDNNEYFTIIIHIFHHHSLPIEVEVEVNRNDKRKSADQQKCMDTMIENNALLF
jgi:hypothetical protein